MTMKILAIGCGNMGAAILSSIKHAGVQIGVVEREIEMAKKRFPEAAQVQFWTTPDDAADFHPEIILLAVKPQQLETVAGKIPASWHDAVLVSILAGKTLTSLSAALGTHKIVRVMPNLPALVGRGMSVGYAENGILSHQECAHIENIFGAIGTFTWVHAESQIDACTVISGSGPGYVFAFAHYLEQAGAEAGVPAEILQTLVRETIHGSACILLEDSRSAEALKQVVASKGGTTEAALRILESDTGFPTLIPAAVQAALSRTRTLS